MPDITGLKPISTLSGPPRPNQGQYYRHESLGSADTMVGRLFGNYYDQGFIPHISQATQRYNNQGPLAAMVNFSGSLTTKTLAAIPDMAGALTSWAVTPGLMIGSRVVGQPLSFADIFEKNPLHLMAKSTSHAADSLAPLFQEEGFHDLNFWQQLSRPGQMATANVDSLAFLASSFLGGWAGSAAKLGARMAPKTMRGLASVAEAGAALKGPNLAKRAQLIDEIATNTLLTSHEAASEAADGAEQLREKLYTDRTYGDNQLTDNEIEAKAQSAHFNIFWQNALTLGITNQAFVKMLSPLFKNAPIASRANPYAIEKAKETLAKAKTYSGFDKFLFDKGYAPGVFTKSLLTQLATEGSEENLQYSIQKMNNAENIELSFFDSLTKYGKDVSQNFFDLDDKERGKAVGLGALLGGGGTVVASTIGALSKGSGLGAANEARNFRKDRDDYLQELNSTYTDFQKTSLFKKTPQISGKLYEKDSKFIHEVDGKAEEVDQPTYEALSKKLQPDQNGAYEIPSAYETDTAGNLIVDEIKVKQFVKDATVHSELDDLLSEELAKVNPDDIKLRLYQREKLSALVRTASKAGVLDLVEERLDALKNIEGAEDLGIQDPTKLVTEVDSLKTYVKRLEALYETVENSTIVPQSDKESLKHNAARKEHMKILGGRIISLDDLIDKTSADYETLLNDYTADSKNPKLKELTEQLSKAAQVETELEALYIEKGKLIGKQGSKDAIKVTNAKINETAKKLSDTQLQLEELRDVTSEISDIELAKLSSLKINQDYLTKARKEAGLKFDQLIDPIRGFESFKSHLQDRRLSTVYDKSRLPFELASDTLKEEYDFYEARKVRQLSYNQKLRMADYELYSEIVSELINYVSTGKVDEAKAKALADFVASITERKIRLHPQDATTLKELLTNVVAKNESELTYINEELTKLGLTPEDIFDVEAYDVEGASELFELYEQATATKSALGNLIDITAAHEAIDALTQETFQIASDSELRVRAAEALIESAQNIATAAFPDSTFNEEFDDLLRVELEAVNLENYLKILQAKKDKLYDPTISEIKRLLKILKFAEDEILRVRADKERKIRKFMSMRLSGLIETISRLNVKFPDNLEVSLKLLVENQPLHAYYVMMDALAAQKVDTQALREELRKTLHNLKVISSEKLRIATKPEELEVLLNSPARGLELILGRILANEKGRSETTNFQAIEQFLSDYDVVNFEKAIPTFSGTLTSQQDLKDVLSVYLQALALKDLELSRSNKSYRSLVTKFHEFVTKQKVLKDKNEKAVAPPTDAQLQAVSELARFILSPANVRHHLFDNVAAIKAPAGAGKTSVIAPLLREVLGLPKEAILPAATTDAASELLAKEMGSAFGKTSFEDLLANLESNQIPPSVAVIVLDEAGALNIVQTQNLATALAKYNQHAKTPLKLVMLYDPSQLTAGNVAKAPLNMAAFYEVPMTIKAYHEGSEETKTRYKMGEIKDSALDYSNAPTFVHNVYDLSPLATTFRSPLNEIVELQNAFRTPATPSSVKTSSNGTSTNMAGALGTTASGSAAQVIPTIVASANANSSRTRMVVVGNEVKKAKYEADLAAANVANVQVLTVEESRGLSADEVYIDITRSDNSNYDSDSTYNQALYTATSRAIKFIHLAHFTPSKHTVDHSLPSKLEAILQAKDDKYEQVITTLKDRIEAFKALGEEVVAIVKPPTKPVPEVEESPNVVPTEEEDEAAYDEVDTPVGITDIVPTSELRHSFHYPQSEAFDPKFGTIVEGDEIYFIKNVSQEGTRIEVYTQHSGEHYRRLAILSDQEVVELSAKLGFDLLTLPSNRSLEATADIDTTQRNLFVLEHEPPHAFNARVGPSSHDIVYEYTGDSLAQFTSTPDDHNGLRRYASWWLTQLYKDPAKHISNYQEILDNPAKFLKIVAFRKEKEVQKAFPNISDVERLPKVNRPYLLLSGVKSNSGKTIATQFVALRPRIINKNSKAAQAIGLQHIDEALALVGELEAQLSKVNLPMAYSKVRLGQPITIGNEIYYPFHKLVTELSNAYRKRAAGDPYTIQMVHDKAAASQIAALLPHLDSAYLPQELLDIAYKLDTLMHGNFDKRRSYEGPAQRAFNKIAKQNLVVSLPNGKSLILRDYYYAEDKTGADIEVATGMSLLGPIKFTRDDGRSYNPTIKKSLVARLTETYNSLVRRSHGESPRALQLKKILEAPNYQVMNVPSLEDLEDLFFDSENGDGNLSNASEGFGLRMPLPHFADELFYTSKSLADVDIEDYVETNLKKIHPTQIVAEFGEVTAEPLTLERSLPTISRGMQLLKDVRKGEDAKFISANYSPEEIQQFVNGTGETNLNSALASYRKEQLERISYEQRVRNIYTALRALDRSKATTTRKDRAKEAIVSSPDIIGLGRESEKRTPRDFIRGALYLELLPALPTDELLTVLDYVRKYFGEDIEGQLDALSLFLATYGGADFEAHAHEVANAYVEAFAELGYEVAPLQQATPDGVLTFVETVVKTSSAYRQRQRETSSVPLNPEFLKWAASVQQALKSNDETALTNKLTGKKNRTHVKTLSELSGIEVDETNADKAVEAIEQQLSTERQMVYDPSAPTGQGLSEDEASEMIRGFSPPTLLEHITQIFTGKRPHREISRFIDFNSRVHSLGADVWGLFKDGVVSVVRTPQGQIGERVLRHEVFHRIFWQYLTHEERLKALDLAEAQWGPADTVTQEERLADAFADFSTPPSNWLVALWEFMRNLWRLLGFTYNNLSSIESLFKAINAGYYKGKGRSIIMERHMIGIGTKFESVEQYDFARQVVFEAFNEIFYNRSLTDRVLSYEEAVNEALKFAKSYTPSTTDPTQAKWELDGLKTLLSDPKVTTSFIKEYFGATNLRHAKQVEAFKTYGAEYLEAKREREELEAYRDLEDSEFTEDDENALIAAQDTENKLFGELYDSELHDPEESMTGRIKQRFVAIKYEERGVEKYADFGSVYQFIVENFASLPLNGLVATSDEIIKRLAPFANSKSKSIRTQTAKHVLKLVSTIRNDATAKSFGVLPATNVSFRQDVSSPFIYAIINKTGGDASVSYEQAKAAPETYAVVTMDATDTFQDMVTSIVELTGLKHEQIAKTYYHFEDINFLRTLLMAAGSLGKANPQVGIQEWYYGQYKTRYVPVATSSSKRVYESRIAASFVTYANTQNERLFGPDFLEKIAKATTLEEQKNLIQAFVTLLGLPKTGVNTASDLALTNVFNTLKFAAPQLQAQFTEFTLDIPFGEADHKTAYELITDQGSLVATLTEMYNERASLIENSSYTRGDGKKAYGFKDHSWQTLQLARSGVGAMTTNDRFLRRNIFSVEANLPSQIYGFVEHDSLKTKGNEEFAKFLRREGVRDYYRRNVVHGLLDAFYATQGQSYIQFLPNPSNRRSIFGVRVTALNTKQTHEALLHIIKAQRNRPDPATNPDLAKIKTYAKNWNKFKLPGLTGISTQDKRTDQELLQLVLAHHASQSAKLFERFYSDLKEANTPIQVEKLSFFAERMGFKTKNFIKQSAYVRALRAEKNTDKDTTLMESTRAEQIKQMTQDTLALFNLNHTINSYSLSQWIYGDEAFFKHKEDETKRIQVATATGKRVLIDPLHGLPPTSRVGVFADIKTQVPELEGMRTDSLGDSFDSTDAEGYMLPSFYHKIAAAAGIESETDIVLKPVYYSITNGIPTAIKYSVKVLTDELTAKFPHLKAMRDFMEKNNLPQMVAGSAVKVGTPSRMLVTNEYGLIDVDSLHPDAIVEIDNANLLFQLNPAHDVETTVANPSQGTSVMNTNGLNEAETQQLFNLNSLVIDLGLRKLNRKLKLTRKGTLTKKSRNEIRRALLKTSETIPGNRDLYYLLSHKDANGNYDVPMSLPLIASKVVSSISSIFSRDTVSFRFAGSKLVLQSDMGTQHFIDDKGKLVTEPLKFKDEEGYTEVFLPASYREFFYEGDKIMMTGKDSLVGFRIPSSNYHSLLALKVKGFYPVPPASQGNVVIAPSPIVYYHGSDYDVDTLFIIRKESWKKPSIDLSPYISRYESVDSDVTISNGDIVGANNANGLPLHTYLESTILKYDQEIEDKRAQITTDLPAPTKRELERELTSLTSSVDVLTEVAQLSAKNAIVELFSSNLRDPKNRTDLLTPISFEQVASLKSRKVASSTEEGLNNINIKNPYGEIRTGELEVAKLPDGSIEKVVGEHNGELIKVKIDYDKLRGTLLARKGKYVFRAMQGRFFVIAKVGKFYLPFYQSSAGTSGKVQGLWYPFFGYTGNWLVKGHVKDGQMQYSEDIDKVTELLNTHLQIPGTYIDNFGEVANGMRFLNKRADDGSWLPNLDRKVYYDLNTDVAYENWFVDFDRKEGNTYTEEQFVHDRTGFNPTNVVNDGTGGSQAWIDSIVALTQEGGPLIKKKLDSTEDSLMEMWAKLEAEKKAKQTKKPVADYISEFPTEDEVNDLIYPEGELSDFLTQEQIKTNTDSGGMGIGIAANTLGAVARTFSAEPIEVVTDTETGEDIVEGSTQAKELGQFDNLVRTNPRYVVKARKMPTVKGHLHLRFEDQVVSKFSRQAIDLSTGEPLTHNGYVVNIFETYDTIENLAIDNVKEQKLFILGFNNNNANALLSALAFGIPLKSVSKLFRTPFLADLYIKGRIYPEKFLSLKDELATELFEDFQKGLLTSSLEGFWSTKEFDAVMASDNPRKAFEDALNRLSTKEELLDQIYVGKADMYATKLSNYAALNNAHKLTLIGEQLFKHAMIFSTLKRLPNSKHRIDGIIHHLNSLVKFASEDEMRRSIMERYGEKFEEHLRSSSEQYRELAAKDQAKADKYLRELMSSLKESDLYRAAPKQMAKLSMVNRLLRRTISKEMKPSNDNIFETNNLLSLPHLYSAYRALVQLQRVIESSFAMHYPEVREFAKSILDDSGMYVLPFKRYQTIERIQENFLGYIASSMTLSFGNEDFELGVPDTDYFNSPAGLLYGEEGWTQDFVRRYEQMATKHEDNILLASTEVAQTNIGLKKLVLTADKVGNEETVERLRAAFRELVNEEPEFARDLFKYAIITKGMFFSRTSFSLIFPTEWAATYGQSLENRLNSIIFRDMPGKTLYYAKILKDEFFFQYIRRNQGSLPYVRAGIAKAEELIIYKDSRGFKRKVNKGSIVLTNGETIHFDLWYNTNQYLPKYIKTFDSMVYAKIYEGGEGTFYRKITVGSKDNLLKFSPDKLEGALDMSKLLNPTLKVFGTDELNKDGNILTPLELTQGEEIYLHDVYNASPSKLTRYKVSTQHPTIGGKHQYKIVAVDTMSLLNTELVEEQAKPFEMLQLVNATTSVVVSTARKAVEKARRDRAESALALVRQDQYTSEANVLALDIKDISDMSDEEVATYTNNLRIQIRNLPSNTKIYVSPDLLAPLMDGGLGVAKIIAQDLYAKTGFAFSIISEEVEDTLSTEAKRLIKQFEIISAIVTDPALIKEAGDDHSISLRARGKYTILNRLEPGTIIALGKDENGIDVYGYVLSIDSDTKVVTFKMFKQDVFDLLNSPIVDLQTFEQAVSDKIKC